MESRPLGVDAVDRVASPATKVSESAGAGKTARSDAGGRLRRIDTLRLLICLCVLARHAVIAQYAIPVVGTDGEHPAVGALTLLTHFARNAFFFVSALVLVYTYAPRLDADGRLPNAGAVRSRRLRLIGVPYVIWTVLYLFVPPVYGRILAPLTGVPGESWSTFIWKLPDRFVQALPTGGACYHLYFLVVTLQFTALFPLFLRLLHRTRGRHGWLLAGAFVLQLITLVYYDQVGIPGGTWRSVLGDSGLLAYQLCLLAGGLAGLYLEQVHAWMMRYRVFVLAALPIATAALLWSYRLRLETMDVDAAADAMQPIVLIFATAMTGALYLAAVWLAELRSPLIRKVIDYGAKLSFGIYLIHPLVLVALFSVWIQLGWSGPAPWQGLVALVVALVGTVAVCALLHRTRFSLRLIGRPRLDPQSSPRWRRPQTADPRR